MTPNLPEPPEPPRPKMISVRLSVEEMEQLERVQTLLAKHWRPKNVEKAEAVRASVKTLLAELEKQFGGERAALAK